MNTINLTVVEKIGDRYVAIVMLLMSGKNRDVTVLITNTSPRHCILIEDLSLDDYCDSISLSNLHGLSDDWIN